MAPPDSSDTAALEDVTSNLMKVRSAINGLHTSLDEDDSLLDVKQSAQLNVGLAFALGSLYYVMLNCKGAGQSTDGKLPVNGELDRIKEYVQRLSKMNNNESRKLVVDSVAAARMVKHNLDSFDSFDGPSKKQRSSE